MGCKDSLPGWPCPTSRYRTRLWHSCVRCLVLTRGVRAACGGPRPVHRAVQGSPSPSLSLPLPRALFLFPGVSRSPSISLALPASLSFVLSFLAVMHYVPCPVLTRVRSQARFELDEKELREMAGKVRGTVGVEHTVDTFLGFAEFKPTGTKVLDPFATQANIHLEKTSFFSVSTHGVNDYTFLEYINLRLVAVYDEDTDPTETVAENGDRTSRTNSTGAAHYVQITFTLGAQYEAIETGLIPLDSVRVGQGTLMASAFEDKARTVPGMTH
eukprot:2468288-Rhodomonas_salina.1